MICQSNGKIGSFNAWCALNSLSNVGRCLFKVSLCNDQNILHCISMEERFNYNSVMSLVLFYYYSIVRLVCSRFG